VAWSSRKRPRLTWKQPEAARIPEAGPHPFVGTTDLPENMVDLYNDKLVVGSMWLLSRSMTKDERYKQYKQHEFPYLAEAVWYGGSQPAVPFPIGTLCVYTGTVRVEESNRNSDIVRVLRHTFLVGGSRFMLLDLSSVAPT